MNTSMIEVLRRPVEYVQYCSIDYQSELRRNGALISMSGKGNCYDNAGFYNPVRRHSALDYQSPVQFENRAVK